MNWKNIKHSIKKKKTDFIIKNVGVVNITSDHCFNEMITINFYDN